MDTTWVYMPLLDLFGKSEGTDPPKGRGYNETLSYGAYTNGPVNLVSMTLAQIDALQTRMLKHPKNAMNSSAVGRYQIVRTTLREIKSKLKIPDTALFDEKMQDRMGCYLLGKRGVDRWLAGKMSTDAFIDELAKEWASIPTHSGSGYYSGQRAGVTVAQVKAALDAVRSRAKGTPAPSPKPTPPIAETVPATTPKRTGFWAWLASLFRRA